MRPTLLVAGDSLRNLLHQRLLVVLVLGTLGLSAAVSVATTYGTNMVVQGSDRASEVYEGELDEDQLALMRQGMESTGTMVLGGFCWFTALAWSVLSGAAFVIYSWGHGLDLKLALAYAPWLMLCQNLMMGSAALLLSLLVHPAIAGVAAFFASASYFSPPNPLYYILPSYDPFNLFTLFWQRRMIGLEEISILTLYALDVSAIFLLLAWWRFRSRDLL